MAQQAKLKAHCHPTLNESSKPRPGIYRSHRQGKNFIGTAPSYITIGDPYQRTIQGSSRFKNKQFITNPPKDTSGNIGHFEKYKYSSDNYSDQTKYLSKQPMEKRLLGFGSHDAAKRDEFTTTVRTEQYRQQLKFEGLTKSPDCEMEEECNENSFPVGLKETKFLYDIGRTQETSFDPKSSRDTFYNALMCKSRNRGPRRTGGYHLTSAECGQGVLDLDHAACKPTHGHQKATKSFFDRSHLGESPIG